MSVRRLWLLPLVPLYAAGVAWKSGGFARHPERAKRLQQPVVSVGSLSAGGAGKTPFVIALGEALRRAGYGIDVLSRGHGRTSDLSLRVQPSGSVNDFGDEPLLIAQRLACPVYVARERLMAGRMAETDRHTTREDRRPSVHLLDDGFQHRKLARAVDIVLFTAEDATDMLLPAGNLREPLRALRRATVIAVRHEEEPVLRPVLERIFAGLAMPRLWIIERRYAFVEGKPSLRPLAFCGIARPEDFRASLAKQGVLPAAFMHLRDHQRYDDALIAKLIARAASVHADGFVTTAKDAVKLTPSIRAALSKTGPLTVSDVLVQLHDEPAYIAQLTALIAVWSKQPRSDGAR
jgi:tetraacyldisaccharide 4'-kinase